MKKRAVPAPASEQLCNVKQFGARCTILCAIFNRLKKRAVPAPASERNSLKRGGRFGGRPACGGRLVRDFIKI